MQRLDIAREDAVWDWVAASQPGESNALLDENGQSIFDQVDSAIASEEAAQPTTIFWAHQDGRRPPTPFVVLDIIAGPQSTGKADERYKAEDTFGYTLRKRATLSVQIFAEDALVRANALADSLELPTRQAMLQAAGIAVWDHEGPRDITGLEDTRHQPRAVLDIFIAWADEIDDQPGEIRSVHVVGSGDVTADKTIDVGG